MLNPLGRHKSNRSSDITSDFEGPISTDTAGYIGKEKRKEILKKIISVLFLCHFHFSSILIINDIEKKKDNLY